MNLSTGRGIRGNGLRSLEVQREYGPMKGRRKREIERVKREKEKGRG